MPEQLESSIPAKQQEQSTNLAANGEAMNEVDGNVALASGTDAEAGASEESMDAVTEAEAAAVKAEVEARATAAAEDAARVESMVGAITTLFETTFSQLVALRDERYSAAIKELELEADQLSVEYTQAEVRIQALEAILPGKERVIRHEADLLIVSGAANAKQDAKAKMAELRELQHKPAAMREQQKEIHARLDEIRAEKRDIAKQVFEDWLAKVQPIIRASEHGLFITLLSGLEQSFYEFQASTGTGTSNNRQRPLLNQSHIVNLTSDGRSAEWIAGHHWYA